MNVLAHAVLGKTLLQPGLNSQLPLLTQVVGASKNLLEPRKRRGESYSFLKQQQKEKLL